MSDAMDSARTEHRPRTDQPTIATLTEAMDAARDAAVKCLHDAGFKGIQVVVNAVVTSLDPDDDWHTWAVGTLPPDKPDPLLRASLMRSAEECGS
jgi:hypothetical protein